MYPGKDAHRPVCFSFARGSFLDLRYDSWMRFLVLLSTEVMVCGQWTNVARSLNRNYLPVVSALPDATRATKIWQPAER
jgi:hypothetical protein